MLRLAPLEGELRIARPPTGLGFPSLGYMGVVSWNPPRSAASRAHLLMYHVCGIKLSMTSAHPYPAFL